MILLAFMYVMVHYASKRGTRPEPNLISTQTPRSKVQIMNPSSAASTRHSTLPTATNSNFSPARHRPHHAPLGSPSQPALKSAFLSASSARQASSLTSLYLLPSSLAPNHHSSQHQNHPLVSSRPCPLLPGKLLDFVVRTSAAFAAADFGSSPSLAAPLPPTVRPGPETVGFGADCLDAGIDARSCCGGAEPSVRPGPAKLSCDCLPHKLPIVSGLQESWLGGGERCCGESATAFLLGVVLLLSDRSNHGDAYVRRGGGAWRKGPSSPSRVGSMLPFRHVPRRA